MTIHILTLFPKFFDSPLQQSILGRAQSTKLHDNSPPITITIVDIRAYAPGKHRVTDDRPYGGGPGMVMKVEPIFYALEDIKKSSTVPASKRRVILTSEKGEQYTQQYAQRYSSFEEIVIICGHYEGVDERVSQHLVDEEISIGEYVLTGGEVPALVICDSVMRLIPSVLGNQESLQDESHTKSGSLAYPQYTRPESFKGWKVPEVLLSGNHKKIDQWRDEHSTL